MNLGACLSNIRPSFNMWTGPRQCSFESWPTWDYANTVLGEGQGARRVAAHRCRTQAAQPVRGRMPGCSDSSSGTWWRRHRLRPRLTATPVDLAPAEQDTSDRRLPAILITRDDSGGSRTSSSVSLLDRSHRNATFFHQGVVGCPCAVDHGLGFLAQLLGSG